MQLHHSSWFLSLTPEHFYAMLLYYRNAISAPDNGFNF